MLSRMQSLTLRKALSASYPWTTHPLIIGAPMRVFSGPESATAITLSGGIGFIGPGLQPSSTASDLQTAKSLLSSSSSPSTHTAGELEKDEGALPVGVAFQLWNGNLESATEAVAEYRPVAAWLFAPRNGQTETDEWARALRGASSGIKIWLQVGTVQEAVEAARSDTPPDVLVIQGAEAGGHGRAEDGVGVLTLLPEVADRLAGMGKNNIPLVAAGGIIDGRGVVAALGVGAAGAAMGTRFLAAKEARISKGYQDEVVRAGDGAVNTVRTHLYNHLRGTFGWPEQWSPRTIVNKSWEEHKSGVSFDELKKRHDEALKRGSSAWGPDGRTATYAGAGIGLVKTVKGAGEIVEEVRGDAVAIIQSLQGLAS